MLEYGSLPTLYREHPIVNYASIYLENSEKSHLVNSEKYSNKL